VHSACCNEHDVISKQHTWGVSPADSRCHFALLDKD